MILDNADDSEIFFQSQSSNRNCEGNTAHLKRSLLCFIPQKPHGKILITSRDRIAAYNLVGDFDNLVKVNPMDVSESLSLLKTKLSIDAAMEIDAAQLLEALDHIPLAITQAGAFIRLQEPMMTISSYLSEFRKNETNQTTLLNKDTGDFRRDKTVPNSVIVTWEISFNQICQQHQSAADLLSLMSLFQRQNIPDFLIREHDDDLVFIDHVNPLISFSLVNVESGGKLFNMHRLVQLATRKWLQANQLLSKWTLKAVERMAESFPVGKYENWEICQLLLPHAEEIITCEAPDDKSKLHYASLLRNTAWYFLERGNYNLAVQRSEQSLRIRSQLLDEEDGQVISSMLILASAYEKQGRWKEAEKLEVQAVKTEKRVPGAEHSSTLSSISNLASTLDGQGRWKEAEELQLQVMKIKKRVLGADHPNTLISMSCLSSTFRYQGRFEEAENLEMQVMKSRKRKLGAEHPETLISMNNLALMFWDQERLKEAEELAMQVMEISKRVLGAEHPHTLTNMTNLAWIWNEQDHVEKASVLLSDALELSERVLGIDHPDTIDCKEKLQRITQTTESDT